MAYPRLDRPRLALVTGASDGIGYALSQKLAARGYDIIMTSANRAKLSAAARMLMKEYPDRDIQMVVTDLSVPDGPRQLYTEVLLLRRPLDVLVNNAGIGLWGKFAETDSREDASMVQLNVISLMAVTKFFLPQMLRLHEGRILFTADAIALSPQPNLVAYAATKAFVYAFAKGLAEELRSTGVSVAVTLPGPTRTNFHTRAGVPAGVRDTAKHAAPADTAQDAYEALMQEESSTPVLDRLLAAAGIQLERKSMRTN